MEDFDKYLSGEMNEEERRRFEQAMADDPALQAEWQVWEGLRQLRQEKKVAEVAVARKAWERQRLFRRLLMGCALAGLFVLAVFVFFKNEKTPTVTAPPGQNAPTEQPVQPTEKEDVEPVLPQKKETKQAPIAATKPSGNTYPAPNVRGENAGNKAWKALLDQVWHTDYPPAGAVFDEPFGQADQLLKDRDFNKAYVNLQQLERSLPDNDTLCFMKGYCLMQMGEGAEALAYFEKIETPPPAWEPQLQWYRGLSLLLAGEKEKALAAFRGIASAPQHPYRPQSQRAIRLLE